MGRKRKQGKTEEEIRRKIKKLEDQLAQTANKSVNLPSEECENSSPLTSYRSPLENLYEDSLCCESPVPDTIQNYECIPSSHTPSPRPATPHPVSPSALLQPAALSPKPGTSAETTNTEELILDAEVLELLGDAPKADTSLGPSIHKDIARRWQDILAKGLPKDVKEKLLKDYLVPGNCDLLLAPALNPEVKAALADISIKRDTSLLYKQKQLGIALSALAAVTELVIANETSKQKILKPLSDACRILCDSHFNCTRSRRSFLISAVNSKLKDTLIESKRDNFLFGENMSEKLKVAKTIQKSGDALKSNAQRPRYQQPNVASTSGNNKARLNYVPQHRKMDNKPNAGHRAPYAQRQSTSNMHARRPNDRPAPARLPAPQRR